jgi:peroxiredoxin
MLLKRAVVACIAVALAAPAFAEELKIGSEAPNFEGLTCQTDKEHCLADFKDKKAVVLFFTCNTCPVAVAYEDRMVEFATAYKEKGVQFIAVNTKTSEGADEIKAKAEEAGFNFPYVNDADQTTAAAYGATCTPHVFVVADGKVVYEGAFDNSMKNPTDKYLANAVDEILAGKEVSNPSTKQVGCGISYKK